MTLCLQLLPAVRCPAGWVGGIFILLLFYVITLWSSLMLAECQETNGVKHPTYRAAVLHVLGEQQQQQHFDVLLRARHRTVAATLCQQQHLHGNLSGPARSAYAAATCHCCLPVTLSCIVTLCGFPAVLAGPVHAAILTLFQYFNLVLSSIGYTVAAGQSLR
jgi:hypothetical protein